jgi:hypothetical protein
VIISLNTVQAPAEITDISSLVLGEVKSLSIKVAARSKGWTVFARSNAGVVGSNPTEGMDVCVRVYSVFLLSCVYVAAFRRADHSYRLCKKVYETEEEARAQQRGCSAIDEWMKESCPYSQLINYYAIKTYGGVDV